METAPRVVIVHDDDLVRDELRLACDPGGVLVAGEAPTYDDLLYRCAGAKAEVTVTADRLGDSLVEDALPMLWAPGRRSSVLSADPSPERLSQLLARDLSGNCPPARRPP